MKRIALIITALLLSMHVAFAITHPDERLKDPALEARAMALTQQLRCVVCQNESIEASRADIARDLRVLVRSQIAEGKTDAEIIALLQTSYGDYILLDPPFAPRTWVLWLAPVLVMGAGGYMALNAQRRKRRR